MVKTENFNLTRGRGHYMANKPKMAYSRDLPKMATRQQCGILDWNCSDTLLEIETGDMVWFGMVYGGRDVRWLVSSYMKRF